MTSPHTDRDAARPIAVEAARRAEKLPAAHAVQTAALTNLAHLTQDSAQAEELFERVIAMRERAFGADDRRTISARRNLVVALRSQGRLDEGIAVLREVLVATEHAVGPGTEATDFIEQNLAVLLMQAGQRDEALAILEGIVAWRSEHFGPEDRDTLNAMMLRAQAHWARQDYEEADAHFGETARIADRALGPAHNTTRRAMIWRSRTRLILGDAEMALALARSALREPGAIREYTRAEGLVAEGRALAALRRMGEAESVLRVGIDEFEEGTAERHLIKTALGEALETPESEVRSESP